MEPLAPAVSVVAVTSVPETCPVCHQPLLPAYYFCPNCGASVHTVPLSTTPLTQAGIYAFSIILPVVCYVFVTRWPGIKYFKSKDPKAKRIGEVAWALLILSTVITFWLAIVWTQEAVQSSLNSINAEMSAQ